MTPEPISVGFMMDQVAGHVTNYRNLRRVVDNDPAIRPTWHEVSSFRPDGRLEQMRERLAPFVPTYLTGNLRAAYELRRGLHAGSYDAIFTNVRVGVLFSRSYRRVPTLIDFDVTPRQLDAMPYYTPVPDRPKVAEFKGRLCRQMFRSATVLQAWSNWARQSAIDDYGVDPDKVIVNPPGVDLAFWRPPPERRVQRGRPLRVLFVGGDFERKGGDLLLEWRAQSTCAEEVELHLVTRASVAGAPGVHVHNDLDPNTDELLQLYWDADVFVLPSRDECFGIATIEAMATGLPVIASAVGGTPDIVNPGVTGYLVRPGCESELATVLDRLVTDSRLRETLGVEARQVVERRFDVNINATRTVGELTRIAQLAAAASK